MKELIVKSNQLLKNISWTILAEAFARVTRLLAVVVLASYLPPSEYGIACLALITHELIRVFSRSGAGARIIQCEPNELSILCGNAVSLQWFMCLSLATVQLVFSNDIAEYYEQPELASLLELMALTYLVYPLVAIRVFMLQRANNFKLFGFCSGLSVGADNLATVIFALMECGIYSVAYAKIVGASVWFISFRICSKESARARFDIDIMPRLAMYSVNVLIVDLLKLLRSHGDILIAGKLFSPDLFGLYSFAKNAGVGLGVSISNAYLSCIYPYLCKCYRAGEEVSANARVIKYAGLIGMIFILQSVLAPTYVTVIFSETWEDAGWIVSILCVSALPSILVDTGGSILRANKRVVREYSMLALYLIFTVSAIAYFSPKEPSHLAAIITVSSFSWPLIFLMFNRGFFHNFQIKTRLFCSN